MDRDRRKTLSTLELWVFQVLDAFDAVKYLHEQGFIAASISAENVYYAPTKHPHACLHVPGLRKVALLQPREKKWSSWPYYCQNEEPLTQFDDVIAASVLLVEILLADDYCRKEWPELVANHERTHDDPLMLLARELGRFEGKNHQQVAPILGVIKQVLAGEVRAIEPLSEAVVASAKSFKLSSRQHDWRALAYHGCSRTLRSKNLDFATGNFFHD